MEAVGGEVRGVIGELRELGRGIHPAVLANEGLAATPETLATLAPLPVTVRIVPGLAGQGTTIRAGLQCG